MPLLNVRLDDDDQRRAEELRREGIAISHIVRAAIRAEHARRIGPRRGQRASAIVAEILERFPDAPGARGHGIDTTDRLALQRYVAARLRRRAR